MCHFDTRHMWLLSSPDQLMSGPSVQGQCRDTGPLLRSPDYVSDSPQHLGYYLIAKFFSLNFEKKSDQKTLISWEEWGGKMRKYQ